MIIKSIIKGLIGALVLLSVYSIILTLVSGWVFAEEQFYQFWYFIIALALGFGVQVGLYSYLENMIHTKTGRGTMVVTGATSTIAMISCCSHYLINILPIIGIAGIVTLITQYQIELFWVGILANLIGIGYITNKIIQFSHPRL